MARQRMKKGRPVSGWVILDKPLGMGSTQAVGKIKWLFNAQKAGHAGTLDPLATGMLPIALGEATKTVPYVMDGAKVYSFTVSWGEERTTDDGEGVSSQTSDKRPTRADIEAVLDDYRGIIQQTPPQFSAIKIAGERAYDMARDGQEVDIPAREVEIVRLEITGMDTPDFTQFEVECGKGTYVRAIARDIGRQLGCFGYISQLRREMVAPFKPESFITIEELEALRAQGEPKVEPLNGDEATCEPKAPHAPSSIDFSALDQHIINGAHALEGMPNVSLSPETAKRVRLGNPVVLLGRDAPLECEEAYATFQGRLLAIGAIATGQFHPKRVFKG